MCESNLSPLNYNNNPINSKINALIDIFNSIGNAQLPNINKSVENRKAVAKFTKFARAH